MQKITSAIIVHDAPRRGNKHIAWGIVPGAVVSVSMRPVRAKALLHKLFFTYYITESQSKAHPGDTLTIYPKPMVNIEALEKVVKKTLDTYDSGVVEVETETKSEVEFKSIEQKILEALDEARAIIDVSVAWFTNTTLQKKLLEKQNEGCKVRIMIDANYTNCSLNCQGIS